MVKGSPNNANALSAQPPGGGMWMTPLSRSRMPDAPAIQNSEKPKKNPKKAIRPSWWPLRGSRRMGSLRSEVIGLAPDHALLRSRQPGLRRRPRTPDRRPEAERYRNLLARRQAAVAGRVAQHVEPAGQVCRVDRIVIDAELAGLDPHDGAVVALAVVTKLRGIGGRQRHDVV